ncbi:MAG: hypothetical protein OEW42_12405 [Acidimicrobiia bacterium]|nr:hypothetical protein [Acidimicrobiia bacterium]MDH5236288.1 hypothetical protein [Acidimicrobiia bacterium]
MDKSSVPGVAKTALTPPALALRLLCEAVSRRWFGADWKTGITDLAWRLATEPTGSVSVEGVAPADLAAGRQAFAWWADRGEVWLEETDAGLVELPIPHWIAARTPVEEPASALEDPNVQLAVATAATQCARCGAPIAVGDTYGLVQMPDGPSGWCCHDCVTGAA